MIRLDQASCRDLAVSRKLEWLETNGLGGWASSTVSGAHTRRYHGLLIAPTRPPVGRMLLVSRLDETLRVSGQSRDLGCNIFQGAVHPLGFEALTAFERDLFPVATYEALGVRLQRTIACLAGENATVVLYEVLAAPGPFTLELRPFLAARDIHSLVTANPGLDPRTRFAADILSCRPYEDVAEIFIGAPGFTYEATPAWWYRFEYEEERSRGLDFQEDLWTPGILSRRLEVGDRLGLILSTESPGDRSALDLFASERRRREEVIDCLPVQDDLARTLGLAADQFVVRRGAGLKSVIAGYPWFGDWGRDTMIALPGLCLATGRVDDARDILLAFAAEVDRGMLPNRFPDEDEAPEFNTVDATLWFFVAIHEYLARAGDETDLPCTLLPVLRDIVAWHDRGTRFGIRVDDDGLLRAGEPGSQLTWMDARVDGREITPRTGKPVEINALWYNALKILAAIETRVGSRSRAEALAIRAEAVRARFVSVFWNAKTGCLFDVVGDTGSDPSLRPNQVIVLALPFAILPDDLALSVLAVSEAELLTPFGLRTLAPGHPQYVGTYGGNPASRDGAYHQGTVWPWLLGPFGRALIRYRGAAGRRQAADLLTEFVPHLREGCLGSVSEVFDGDGPQRPGGAIAQAWSVAEILRLYFELHGQMP